MKRILLMSFLLVINMMYAQDKNETSEQVKPEDLVEAQLVAYNKGDIEAFLKPYAEGVEIYNFPNILKSKGKEKIRPTYNSMFKEYPELHCELVNRIVKGNIVIDHERITIKKGEKTFETIAIYKIEKNKIVKVYFN